jgi:hypothetical protein
MHWLGIIVSTVGRHVYLQAAAFLRNALSHKVADALSCHPFCPTPARTVLVFVPTAAATAANAQSVT